MRPPLTLEISCLTSPMRPFLAILLLIFPLAAQSPELVQAKAQVKALAREISNLDKTFQVALENELRSSYKMGPKDEFETTTEYQARLKVAEGARQQLLPGYERQKADRLASIEDELAALTSRPWPAPIRIRLGPYDADRESFPFHVQATGDSGSIDIPREVAKGIKTNLGALQQTGWWRLSGESGAQLAAVTVNHSSGAYLGMVRQPTRFELVRTFSGHSGYVLSVAFSPKGQLIASGSWDNTVKLWRANDGALLKTFSGHSDGIRSVAFSPDGKLLASGSSDNTVKLWRVGDGKLMKTFKGHSNSVLSVAFSPNGQLIASGSSDSTIKLWRAADGNLLKTLSGHSDYVHSVAFSPDGELLASGSRDNTVKLWRVGDGTLVKTLSGRSGVVSSVAFSPNGTLLASGSADKTVKLWRVANGKLVKTISGHSRSVLSVAFSPDGDLLASGGADGTIKLWRVGDGTLVNTFSGHSAYVSSVAFSPDGKLIASGSYDKTVKLWRVGNPIADSRFLAAIRAGGGVTGLPGRVSLPPALTATAAFTEVSGDNILGAGEEGLLILTLSNAGQGAARGVEIKLSSESPGLAFPSGSYVGGIAPGESRRVELPLSGLRTLADGSAAVTASFTEARGFEPDPIRVTFGTAAYLPPALAVSDIGIDDASGNGMIEPGEVVSIVVRVQNRGQGRAEGVRGRLILGRNIFLAGEAEAHFDIGLLPPGGSADIPFEFYTNRRAVKVDIKLTLSEATGSHGLPEVALELPFNRPVKRMQQVMIAGKASSSGGGPPLAALSIDIERDIPWGRDQRKDGVALIIANRYYSHPDVPEVRFAHRDGETVRRYLIRTLGYREGNIFVEYDATLATFRTALKKLRNAARPKADIFVYYTGHGAPDPESDQGYFVPVDTDPNYVAVGGLSLKEFYSELDGIKAATKTVVIDACFSGSSDQGMIIRNVSPIFLEVKEAGLLGGGITFSSSSGDEVSSWFPEKKHGLYTYYFLKGLQGTADGNRNGVLTAGELQTYLLEQVPYMARRLNNRRQTPQLTADDPDFVLVRYR